MRRVVPVQWVGTAVMALSAAACVKLPSLACDRNEHCPAGYACRLGEVCVPLEPDAPPNVNANGDAGGGADGDAGGAGDDAGAQRDAGVEIDDAGADVTDAGEIADGGALVDDAGPADADAGVGSGEDAGSSVGDWWDLAWQRRVQLSIDSGAEALADFPLLVVLDASAIDLSGAAIDGRDVRFVDADGVTELAHEIEAWKSTGTSTVWVRVPLIGAAPATKLITMYFDNDAAADAQDSAAVWSAGYAGVWHLQRDPSVAVDDVTVNESDGTALGISTADRVQGVIDDAFLFDGASVVRIDGSAQGPLNRLGPLMLSAWVRPESSGSVLARREGGTAQWQLQLEPISSSLPQPSFIWSDDFGGQCIWATTAGIALGEWHHIAVAFAGDGAPSAFYVDGTSAPFSQENFCSSAPSVHAIDVAIGARWAGVPSTGFGLSGTIDEARIETEIRSPAWMSAQHRSMTNTLVTVGTVEAQ